MQRDVALQTGAYDRRLGYEKRHRLTLHVGTHKRAVRIVVLEEWNQSRRHPDHLTWRHVDVLNLIDWNQLEVRPMPGNNRFALDPVAVNWRVGRRHERFGFFVGTQPN